MRRPLLWLTTAVIGAVATLLSSFGIATVVLFLLLAVPLIVRGDHLAALSGLLTGFGGFWLILLARQIATGGTPANDQYWAAVGILPLSVGGAMLVLMAIRALTVRNVLRGP
jgi:hypothetical protein